MRPRVMATDYEMMHLYALEDPYNAYEVNMDQRTICLCKSSLFGRE